MSRAASNEQGAPSSGQVAAGGATSGVPTRERPAAGSGRPAVDREQWAVVAVGRSVLLKMACPRQLMIVPLLLVVVSCSLTSANKTGRDFIHLFIYLTYKCRQVEIVFIHLFIY